MKTPNELILEGILHMEALIIIADMHFDFTKRPESGGYIDAKQWIADAREALGEPREPEKRYSTPRKSTDTWTANGADRLADAVHPVQR